VIRQMSRRGAGYFLAVALLSGTANSATAEKLKVGIPATEAFSFMAVDFSDHLGNFNSSVFPGMVRDYRL
jgi:hypothetical protein